MVLLRQLTTATSYVDPAHRQATEARVADRLWDHALEAEQGSDAQLQLLKTFATFAATPGQQQTLQGLLDGSVSLPGLIVDTDLRWELLTALVSTGAAGGEEIEAELRRDPTATGQRAAAAARAAVPTTSAKEQVWADAITPDRLPNAVQRAVIAGFNRVKDRSLLAPFARRYFEVIEQVWNDHHHVLGHLVGVVVPHPRDGPERGGGPVPARGRGHRPVRRGGRLRGHRGVLGAAGGRHTRPAPVGGGVGRRGTAGGTCPTSGPGRAHLTCAQRCRRSGERALGQIRAEP